MRSTTVAALVASITTVSAAFQGFNYGSTFTTGAPKQEADFEAEFKTAQGLIGAPGVFNSARLYTTVQAGTANDPISAIQAAINTKTSLLLGIWASAGEAVVSNEIAALVKAIQAFGTDFTSLVAGISVGSEDLYRISPTGLLNKENPGADPLTIANYMQQVRNAIKGTPLANAPIGHVDTWTAWVNGSNQAVIDAADWVGVDAYPYFQETQNNAIGNNKALFQDALGATQAAVGGKPVWVTETGFPVSGKTVGQAVPSLENAKTYWDEVGCPLFGNVNTWWYTMQDASPDTPNPSFGIIGNQLTETPLFDLSCKNVQTSSSTLASSATASSTGSASSVASPSVSVAPISSALAGGSPGVGSGLPGSQSSLESTFVSLVTSTANAGGASSSQAATATGTGAAGGSTTTLVVVPGAGSSSGPGSGSGSGANSTGVAPTGGYTPVPTVVPSGMPTQVPANGAAGLTGSVVAGFVAIFAAMLAL